LSSNGIWISGDRLQRRFS